MLSGVRRSLKRIYAHLLAEFAYRRRARTLTVMACFGPLRPGSVADASWPLWGHRVVRRKPIEQALYSIALGAT